MFSFGTNIIGHKDEPQNLLCCRACLSTDGGMFNIHEYKLADEFSHITGAPVIKDDLPQHLCSICRTLLVKCASFRTMCVQTQQLLMLELLEGQLTLDCIRRINQPHCLNLTLTEVETISTDSSQDNRKIIETLSRSIDTEILPIDKIENIKHESFTNIVDVNSILNKTVEKQLETKNENKCNNKNVNDAKRRKTKTQTRKKKERENDVNIKKENSSDENVVSINNESYEISINNKTVKRQKEKETNARKRDKTSNIRKANKKEKNENDEILKNRTFESDYSVQIVILSKEEQLAEIAARKKTRNYLESNFKCEDCYKGFEAETAYNNHRLRHSPNSGAFICEVCHMRFPKNYMKTYHQSRHRLKIFCTKCSFVSRTKAQATQHHAVHEGKTYTCEHCGKSFLMRSSHLSHVRLAHPERNVACGGCGEVFVGTNGLKMHQAKMHSEKIKCTTCSAKFVSLTALKRHTETAGEHIGLWPCEQCGENCASEDALHQHVRQGHTSRRCEECDMVFPSAEAHATHVQRTHRRQRKRERGRRPGRTRARPGAHMCEQCGRILPSKSYLKIHQRSHQGLKPFSCNECSKSFTTKEYLVIHIRSHSGVKPFQCPSCPLAFTQKGNYLRHHKTAHLGVRESFPCPFCDSMTTTKSSLRVHIDSKHGGKGWPKSRKRAKNPKTL